LYSSITPEDEVVGVDNQAAADQVSVVGVVGHAATGFDLEDDPEFGMEAVNVVGDDRRVPCLVSYP
jgi:hypothetical protein